MSACPARRSGCDGAPDGLRGMRGGRPCSTGPAMTSGIYGTADSDFTPVMFDRMASLWVGAKLLFPSNAQV